MIGLLSLILVATTCRKDLPKSPHSWETLANKTEFLLNEFMGPATNVYYVEAHADGQRVLAPSRFAALFHIRTTVWTEEEWNALHPVATNLLSWDYGSLVISNSAPTLFLALKSPDHVLSLSFDDEELALIHINGTVTLSNTNLDFVSSNFWKVLAVYFTNYYQLKP